MRNYWCGNCKQTSLENSDVWCYICDQPAIIRKKEPWHIKLKEKAQSIAHNLLFSFRVWIFVSHWFFHLTEPIISNGGWRGEYLSLMIIVSATLAATKVWELIRRNS